ncbi:MAG: copper amine oxidase N-terminal domain-containing protein, partial [Thermacetogeniaceae bacterium]
VPIRKIANALGLSDNDVTWSADGTVTINDGSNQILITDNDQQVSLNGNSYSLDTPAQIIDGRMMVPLRAISQLLNKNVQWYPTGQIVEIS